MAPVAAAKKPLTAINPNWAQLQEKLRSEPRPNASFLGKRKRDPPQPQPAPAPAAEEPSPPVLSLLPSSSDCSVTKEVAMDCEMVGVSSLGNKSALGRVSVVNSWGNVLYDEYVRPIERIVDFRTSISGIRPWHMRKAKDFWLVQKEVAELLKGHILVGHALQHDLKVLLLSHPRKDIRDTASYELFRREGKRASLRGLAAKFLGVKIQQKEHCSVEDARAAMFIYNKHKKDWEKSLKSEFRSKKKNRNRRKKQHKDPPGRIETVL